jgi:hypothetical protein
MQPKGEIVLAQGHLAPGTEDVIENDFRNPSADVMRILKG